MSMCKHWPIVCLLVFSGTVPAQESPGLGESVSPDELAALDFVILPNGSGLPPGAGTAATGTMVYQKNCMACHGEGGKGGVNDALAGGRGSLTSDQPKKTIGSFWPYATTIFDYVRRSMPLPTPGILTNDELYSVTAYLLYINDVIELNTEISAQTLPKVKMPNRDNFVWDYSPQK